MNDIYILKKRKLMYGPYSLEVIKDKGLRSSDMVWFSGLDDWTPVNKVEYLAPFILSNEIQTTKKKTVIEKLFKFLK